MAEKARHSVITTAAAAAGAALVGAAFVRYCVWQNQSVSVTNYRYQTDKLPAAFDGYKIAHLSDLHCGHNKILHERLLKRLKKEAPDCIVVTGDLIDRREQDVPFALQCMTAASKLAPVYFVPGNHEARTKHYAGLRDQLLKAGVTVLENAKETLYRDGAALQLVGVKDPAFITYSFDNELNQYHMDGFLRGVIDTDTSALRILLSHRPELIRTYKRYQFDLVFAGHAHGGQWRIPGIGGLFAPHQGVFPRLTSGMHTFGDTTIVISRGLGNSGFPIRIANRPELIILTLTCDV